MTGWADIPHPSFSAKGAPQFQSQDMLGATVSISISRALVFPVLRLVYQALNSLRLGSA